MPKLEIYTGGEGGHYADRMKGHHVTEPEEIFIETLDGGMESGQPSIAIMMLNHTGRDGVVGQTSARLFVMVAEAVKARYPGLIGGVVASADLASGKATLTVSGETVCTRCSERIPDSFKFCSHCGHRLPLKNQPGA
jgi:hypothetical protein